MSKKKKTGSGFSIRVPAGTEYQLSPIPLVADGAIAQGNSARGQLVPVLIVDATDRPDIVDVINAHTVQPSGDVTAIWANPDGSKKDPSCLIHLILHFIRPVDTYAVIKFQRRHAGLVDQILMTGLTYLQAGAPGDRLANTQGNHRIIVEIRNTDFDEIWERMLFDTLFNEFRGRGLNKNESNGAARKTISEWRRLGEIRMMPRSQRDPRNNQARPSPD